MLTPLFAIALLGLFSTPTIAQQAPSPGTYTGQSDSGKTGVTLVLKDAAAQPDGSTVYAGTFETKAAPGSGGGNQPAWPLSKAVFAKGTLDLETKDNGKVTSVTSYTWDGKTLRGKQTYTPFSGPPVTWGMILTKQ
ncbi:MAG: hypothetical protein AABZ02_15110 [Bacteroidota bacterium]